MSERALLLEAHHTTHIEGTRLTLDQAELLLAGQSVPQADVNDVRELLNYRDAFHLVSEYLDSGAPITEGLVREIHRRLVVGVRGEQSRPGESRRLKLATFLRHNLRRSLRHLCDTACDRRCAEARVTADTTND